MDVAVLTHRSPESTRDALAVLRRCAAEHDAVLVMTADDAGKHGLEAGEQLRVEEALPTTADLAIVLGGDGTILSALRHYAGTDVPVFALNFGEVGFLSTCDPDDLEQSFRSAFEGRFERLQLPAIALQMQSGHEWLAMNDVSVHRKPGHRVADLAYCIEDSEVGRVRCDGVVVATPAGSTGYNLANGGPVLAWGVEGYVVSFIAPHSLTARALVVAPNDQLRVVNRSQQEEVEVHVDGRPTCELDVGSAITVRFRPAAAILAQQPSASFYGRFRERFGRLAR